MAIFSLGIIINISKAIKGSYGAFTGIAFFTPAASYPRVIRGSLYLFIYFLSFFRP